MAREIIKIRQIYGTDYKGEILLMAVSEEGNLYKMRHDPETGESEWEKLPNPQQII